MANVIAKMAVGLGVDASKFNKGMRRASMRVKAFGAGIVRAGGMLGRFRTMLVAAAGPAALGLLVRSQLKVVDSLAKVGDKLGVGTEALAGFHHAAKLAGLETRTFDMAIQRMTRRVAEAALDTGEAKDALKTLGIDAKKFAALGPEESLDAIAEAMKGVSTQGERVRLAFKLFDSEGVAMVNMLQGGKAALEEAREKAEKFGLAISRVDAAQVEAANNAMTDVKAAIAGAARQLTVYLAPYIEYAAKKMVEFGTSGEGVGKKIADAMGWAAKAIAGVLDAFEQIGLGIKKMMRDVAQAYAQWQNFWGLADQAEMSERIRAIRAMDKEIEALELKRLQGTAGERLLDFFEEIKKEAQAAAEETERMRKAMNEVAAASGEAFDPAAFKKMESAAEAIRKSVETPVEKFKAMRTELTELLAKGFLDQETFNRALRKAGQEFLATGEKVEATRALGPVGAAVKGSAEAISATIGYREGAFTDKAFKESRKQGKTLEGILAAIEKMEPEALEPVQI